MNPDATIARLVLDQHGVVTRSQALDSGLTHEQLDHQVERRLLVPIHRGVYHHPAVPFSKDARLLAATLAAGRGAVASHRSAAVLHDFRDVPRWRPEVTVPRTDLPLRAGIHVHRTTLLASADRTTVRGVPCTSRSRTLLDLGAVVPFEVVECAVQDAVIRKLVTHAELVAVVERVAGRGRRGSAALRAVVRSALPDERLESELERRLSLLLPPGHDLVPQHEITCVDGRRVRFDFADPDRMIAIEAMGHRWHGTAKDLRRDLARRRSIEASGWRIYEFGWSDVVEAPHLVRLELVRILA